MIQSVADPEKRSELGMHYTSVPNILKVLAPLFLDSLDADIEKAWERPAGLQRVLERIAHIRVFDPALRLGQLPGCCLSGTPLPRDARAGTHGAS